VTTAKQLTEIPLNMDEAMFFQSVLAWRRLGYGRMMQMISQQWRLEVGDGAKIANDTYNGIKNKRKRCRKEGHDWRPGGSCDWCDRCDKSRPKKGE
jgi:hypothetical protein